MKTLLRGDFNLLQALNIIVASPHSSYKIRTLMFEDNCNIPQREVFHAGISNKDMQGLGDLQKKFKVLTKEHPPTAVMSRMLHSWDPSHVKNSIELIPDFFETPFNLAAFVAAMNFYFMDEQIETRVLEIAGILKLNFKAAYTMDEYITIYREASPITETPAIAICAFMTLLQVPGSNYSPFREVAQREYLRLVGGSMRFSVQVSSVAACCFTNVPCRCL
jgi:hypothetical protein